MTPYFHWSRVVRLARCLRVGVDLLVLAAGLMWLLWAFSVSNLTHWSNVVQRHTKANALHTANHHDKQQANIDDEQNAATWLQGQHLEETQAWRMFEDWLNAGQFGSGHCSLKGLKHSVDKAIELHCVGGQKTTQAEPFALEVDTLSLIVANPSRSQSDSPFRSQKPSPSGPETTEPHVVQGWIDLPSGTQHFNSQHNRWQP